MKKILLATTALVATAGFAAAEVSIGGRAEIGVVGGTNYGDNTQFHTDVDIDFNMSGETPSGIAFGASLDADEIPSGLPASDDAGVSYFVSFGGLRLDMGDVDGAFDAAMIETALAGGTIDDAETDHDGYNGNSGLDGDEDGQIATVSFKAAGFGVFLSTELDDAGVNDPVNGLGVRYSADMGAMGLAVGVGFQSQGDNEATGVSLSLSMASGLDFAVNYSETTVGAVEDNYTGFGVGYSMNALSLGLNYGSYDSGAEGYGLAVNYDLGGGLVAQLGYNDSEDAAGVEGDMFSLGLAMGF